MWPLPKTIALGGVATGNMKAQVAARVAGTRSSKGSMPMPLAIPKSTGRKAAAVGVLLVSSVRNTTMAVTTNISMKDESCQFWVAPPIH